MSSRPSPARSARPRSTSPGPRRLKVVRGNKRGLIKRGRSRRVAPILVLGAILVAATIFTVLLEQVILAQTGFKMAHLRDESVKAEAEHAKLVLKAAKLSSSERIERVAIERLGMVAPADVNYIVANVRTKSGGLMAQREVPALAPDTGIAAGDLAGESP